VLSGTIGSRQILKPPRAFNVRALRFTFLFAIVNKARANQLTATANYCTIPKFRTRMNPKIVEFEELSNSCDKLRSAGKRIVATNGCFDLLHVGHVRYLQAARAFGDVLVVGLNGDRSVRELKGSRRPLTTEDDRAEILAALQCVDLVTVFPQIRATQFLAAVRPAIYVKGGDYSCDTLNEEEHATLKKIGAEIRLIPFEAGYSTSRLIEQIRKNNSW
jgi:D-glycero-beta-D-manno-heptose 1-phosphate adenylyltransferase